MKLEHDTLKIQGGAISLDDNDDNDHDTGGHEGGSGPQTDDNDANDHSSKGRLRKQARKIRASQKKYDARAKPAQVNAHAYTQGTDVYTARGGEGTSLIGHELSHVTQQGGGA